jgi:hypothetical protein
MACHPPLQFVLFVHASLPFDLLRRVIPRMIRQKPCPRPTLMHDAVSMAIAASSAPQHYGTPMTQVPSNRSQADDLGYLTKPRWGIDKPDITHFAIGQGCRHWSVAGIRPARPPVPTTRLLRWTCPPPATWGFRWNAGQGESRGSCRGPPANPSTGTPTCKTRPR